jgi:polyisoprenoid-binding protein YceI
MKLIFTFLLFFSTLFSFETEVFWTAFKTYQKIGVSGTFDNVKTTGNRVENLSVSIQTDSINSGNSGRDFTLVYAFWKVQKVDEILAKVVSIENGKLKVEIEMNGIKREVEMSFYENNDEVVANGVIDLKEFQMMKSLNTVNSTCYILHGGKTWSDVNLKVVIKK